MKLYTIVHCSYIRWRNVNSYYGHCLTEAFFGKNEHSFRLSFQVFNCCPIMHDDPDYCIDSPNMRQIWELQFHGLERENLDFLLSKYEYLKSGWRWQRAKFIWCNDCTFWYWILCCCTFIHLLRRNVRNALAAMEKILSAFR